MWFRQHTGRHVLFRILLRLDLAPDRPGDIASQRSRHSGAGDVVVFSASGLTLRCLGPQALLVSAVNWRPEIDDVFVVVYDSTGFYPLAVRVLRSQTIPGALNGGNPVVFAASDETVTQTITFNNVPAGSSPYDAPFVYFYTSNGQESELQSYPTTTLRINILPCRPPRSRKRRLLHLQYNSLQRCGRWNGSGPNGYRKGWPTNIHLPGSLDVFRSHGSRFTTFNFSYSGYSGLPFVEQDASLLNGAWGSKWLFQFRFRLG